MIYVTVVYASLSTVIIGINHVTLKLLDFSLTVVLMVRILVTDLCLKKRFPFMKVNHKVYLVGVG